MIVNEEKKYLFARFDRNRIIGKFVGLQNNHNSLKEQLLHQYLF